MDTNQMWSGTARVMRGGSVVEEHSVGLLDTRDSKPCWPGMTSQSCSISKLVMSVLVLKLVERGDLKLHETIGRWVKIPAEWSAITLHQLLSHTSGIGHWGDVPGLPRLLTAPPPPEELIALIARSSLVFPPGSGWRYSGPGYLFASLLVEAATSRPYREIVTDLIFTPAGMTSTSSGEDPSGQAGAATGHFGGHARYLHPEFAHLTGSGDLWTTTADLIRLSQALRSGNILSPESAGQLWARHAPLPEDSEPAAAIQMSAYGYGTFLGQVNGRDARLTPGDNPGYQTLLAYLPHEDLDVAVLCNEDAPSVLSALNALTTLHVPRSV